MFSGFHENIFVFKYTEFEFEEFILVSVKTLRD